MIAQVIETHFFIVAIVCITASAAIAALNARSLLTSRSAGRIQPGAGRQVVEQSLAALAVLCVVAGLTLSVARHGGWPLTATAEVILTSAAAATLWHLLCRGSREPGPGNLLMYAIVAGLLLWGMARWPGSAQGAMATTSVPQGETQALPQPWLLVSYLALAVACGAFIKAGSSAVGESSPVLPGLSMLTASLLLQALGGLYAYGVYWSGTPAQSWQLLVWLFYAALWCAFTLLGWPAQHSRRLMTLGLILTLLMFKAMGG